MADPQLELVGQDGKIVASMPFTLGALPREKDVFVYEGKAYDVLGRNLQLTAASPLNLSVSRLSFGLASRAAGR